MKLLNLSALTVATNRCLKIGEKVHAINPLKVIDFIRITEIAQQIDAETQNGGFTAVREVKLIIDLITSTAPSTTEEELMQLGLAELQNIASFIKGADVEGVVEEAIEDTAATEVIEGK